MESKSMNRSKVSVILKSLMAAYIITGILLLILTMLLFKLELDEEKVSIGVIAIYLLSCFSGGFLAGRQTGSKKFLWGMGIGVLYVILLVFMSVVANQGWESRPVQLMTTVVLCAAGGMLGGMLS